MAVIDDDPGVRRAIAKLLSAFGFTAYTFDSAEAFLRTAADSRANCLVIDVHLGEMSGLVLARRLNEAGLKKPIIFMTAVDNAESRSQMAQVGCIACLRKPFSGDGLIEAIVKAMG